MLAVFLALVGVTVIFIAITSAPTFVLRNGAEFVSVEQFMQALVRTILNPVFWLAALFTLPTWIQNNTWVIAAISVMVLNGVGIIYLGSLAWKLLIKK